MSETIQLTVLVENTATGRGLKAEHGLSFHVQNGRDSFLFDTGQSELLLQNASVLGIDLSGVRAVALSHGHFDHTGGLPALWSLAPKAGLFLHPAALQPRYARRPEGHAHAVGMTAPVRVAVRQEAAWIRAATGVVEVHPGLFLTGEIPRVSDFEDVGGPFVLDEAGLVPDPIVDDQALFFDTRDGLVVVLGCAHAGVVNTLRHIRDLTRDRPIHAVLGGMHLLTASAQRIERTFEALRELKVLRLGPAHCTGTLPTARLWTEFPGQCFSCAVGTSLSFQR